MEVKDQNALCGAPQYFKTYNHCWSLQYLVNQCRFSTEPDFMMLRRAGVVYSKPHFNFFNPVQLLYSGTVAVMYKR